MPRGQGAFERKQQEREAQRAAYGFDQPNYDYFAIKGGTYADVRFLEQGDEIVFADVHSIPLPKKAGGVYRRDFICLNLFGDGTACPACQSENPEHQKTTTKGFHNVIWRAGPVYERDANGVPLKDGNVPRLAGRADGIFLWRSSW